MRFSNRWILDCFISCTSWSCTTITACNAGIFDEILTIYGSLSCYLISLFLREVNLYLQQLEDDSHQDQRKEGAQDLRSLYQKVYFFLIVVILFFPSAVSFVIVFVSMKFLQRRILYLLVFLPSCTMVLALAMIYSITKMTGKVSPNSKLHPLVKNVTPFYTRYRYCFGNLSRLVTGSHTIEKVHPITRKSVVVISVQSKSASNYWCL